ncbi:MAG: polyphosphate kinase 1 [Candidatus Eiseniibacteriota bacterium]
MSTHQTDEPGRDGPEIAWTVVGPGARQADGVPPEEPATTPVDDASRDGSTMQDGESVRDPRDDAPAGGTGNSLPAEPPHLVGDEHPLVPEPLRPPDRHRKPSRMADFKDASYYVNRELSLLEFNRRVLEEAEDASVPLLERVKFLSIVDSNLDEFFMVRVAGLKQQIAAGVVDAPADGMQPAEQLATVRKRALELMRQMRVCLQEDLVPALHEAGIHILSYDQLSAKQLAYVTRYFDEFIYPVLTPLAFDPGRPFPFISNLSHNLAIFLRDRNGETRFARLKVPRTLPQAVPLKRSSGSLRKDGTVPRNHYFVMLDQVIIARLPDLFPGLEIIDVHPFHVTRDAENEIQELEASDLLETIEKTVRDRRFGSVIRLCIAPDTPASVRALLQRELQVDPKDVYELQGMLTLRGLMELHGIERHDLKETPFKPALPAALRNEKPVSIFHSIRQGDILLHHPFDSFEPVNRFLEVAATDPKVLAIKVTLYRVAPDSPVVKALLTAVENGKQVSALVELKARFDEESNIGWARQLEKAGVHVVYGLLGLKTHSKVALVVRKEGGHIRRYVHLSTGNYNHVTAQLYTDIGMFTCDEEIGVDTSDLFNYLTGYSYKNQYRRLMVAPVNLRETMIRLIRREIEHQKRGDGGRMIFKTNALVDKGMIREIYRASQSGVSVDLIVRGICCLRPGIAGISDHVRVRSIVGRFLEHSRIFYFRNGGQEEIYLGSADLMPRNIDGRVEVVFPVGSEEHVHHLRDDVLAIYLADNVKARVMQADGTYERIAPDRKSAERIDAQATLLGGRN